MKFPNIFKGVGSGFTTLLGKLFSWDFLFGAGLSFGTKLLRWYGLIAFLSTIILAISTGIQQHSVVAGIIYLVKTIITVDQEIYNLSVNFNSIATPTLWQSIITLLLILKQSFFYVWWLKVFRYIIQNFSWFRPIGKITKTMGGTPETMNQSTPKSQLNWYAFKLLYLFLILSNIANMVWISKEITFTFIPIQNKQGAELVKTAGKNIFHCIDTLLINNWWHWIVAFKGLGHYLFTGSFFKTMSLLTGSRINMDFAINVTENVTR